MYEDQYDVRTGYLDGVSDEVLRNTLGRVWHLEIEKILKNERMYKLLLDICKIEFLQLKGILDINNSKIKFVEKDSSAKKALISKYLNRST